MSRFMLASAAAVGVALGLSGCGGGGGGGSGDDNGNDGAVGLGSKEQVAHELAVIGTFIDADDDELESAEGIAGTTTMKSATMGRAFRKRASVVDAVARGKRGPVAPGKAAQTIPCDGGGTTTVDSGTKNVAYSYFGVASTPSFFHQESRSDCVENDSDGATTYTETESGFFENGGTVQSVGGFVYRYDQEGSGNTPIVKRIVEKNGNTVVADYTDKDLGLFQYRISENGDGAFSIKQVATLESTGTDDGVSFSITLDHGTADAPFTYSGSDGGITLDGDYAYSTSLCDGGALKIETSAPITFGNLHATPVGGNVKLTSGGSAVTVTFQADGSATLQFANGSSATLTQQEIENADPLDC